MDVLVAMSCISIVGMIVEKIANECCKPTHAMYASLASSSMLGLSALKAVSELIKFLKVFG